jgi:hypothetical protein
MPPFLGYKSEKTVIFIAIAIRTSDLTGALCGDVALGDSHKFEILRIMNATLHLGDRVRKFFRNVGAYLSNNLASYSRLE